MISIIVPIYNVEKYLPKCIQSLIDQTYRDIEIILVDDGSPDACGSICDAFARKDPRVKVIHQKNAGVSAARNAGLKAAKGEYIGFCDPDDWAAPEMYEELRRALEAFQADLAICGYNYYNEDYQVDAQRLYPEKETELIDQKTVMDRMADMPPSIRHVVWNKLFRNNLLHGLWFDEQLKSSEDLDFLDAYLKRIQKAAIVHRPCYQNLVRSSGATHGGLSYRVHEDMYSMAAENYPELKNRAMAYLLDVLALKYGMAKKRAEKETDSGKKAGQELTLKKMRGRIKAYAIRYGFTDPEIYWKTRIAYLLMR